MDRLVLKCILLGTTHKSRVASSAKSVLRGLQIRDKCLNNLLGLLWLDLKIIGCGVKVIVQGKGL